MTALLVWGTCPEFGEDYHLLANPGDLARGSGPSLCGVDVDTMQVLAAIERPPTLDSLCGECALALAVRNARRGRLAA